jgi:hypothetical protein
MGSSTECAARAARYWLMGQDVEGAICDDQTRSERTSDIGCREQWCLQYWDCQSPQAALTINLPERCYAMDAHSTNPQDPNNYLVVGTADRHILVYDLRKPNEAYKVSRPHWSFGWQVLVILTPGSFRPSANAITFTMANSSYCNFPGHHATQRQPDD